MLGPRPLAHAARWPGARSGCWPSSRPSPSCSRWRSRRARARSGALERVTRLSRGELARELGRALADARAGASLVQALQGIADRTSLPPLARFVDGVAIAVERGTPLAEVLRAQAVDVREAGKRALLEAGGRKEIAMMVPVVFLVLPVTVLFALFPGFFGFSFAS